MIRVGRKTKKEKKWVYLFRVMSLAINSQIRWFLQISKQITLDMCSYQHANDAPNAMGGHTRLGATFLITYCVACASPLGTG